MVVIRASLIRLSWQSITFFKMVLRPPLLATISGFSSAVRTNMDMHEVNIYIHRLIHYRVLSNQCANPPSSQIMAMQARTIRSRSCGPSLPTAMREFATELGKSRAFTVIIWKIIVKHLNPSMTKNNTLDIVKHTGQWTWWEHNCLTVWVELNAYILIQKVLTEIGSIQKIQMKIANQISTQYKKKKEMGAAFLFSLWNEHN